MAVLSYGSAPDLAAGVADDLETQGRSTSLFSIHTLKPLDRAGLAGALARHTQVVVIKEASLQGGIKKIAWETGAGCRIDAFAPNDACHHLHGSDGQLLIVHDLSRDHILEALR